MGGAIAAAALAAVLAGGGGSAAADAACGAATAGVIATADGELTTQIYANELGGQEVSDDLKVVTGSRRLIAALESHDPAAIHKATSKLVYHPFWHIVRLRVLDPAGHLLADVGGPYVIAPVSGVLHSPAGDVLGSFVMSVQDDVGVTKLERHIVGDPIGIYYRGPLVASLGARFPRRPPRGATLRIGRRTYRTMWLTYKAFPTGTLRALLLVRAPSPALASQSCDAVRAGRFGRVAAELVDLLGPFTQHYYGYSYWVHIYTGSEVFVRNPNGTQLAASDGTNPPALPQSGPFSYEGQDWVVYSFVPVAPTRVYLLVPASTTATGAAAHG